MRPGRSMLFVALAAAIVLLALVAACDNTPAVSQTGGTSAVAPQPATTLAAATQPTMPAVPVAPVATVPAAAPQNSSAIGALQAASLRVAIKPLAPLVVRSESRYAGFSIELWDAIARRNGWSTDYVWYETLPPLLDAVSTSDVDVGIAGISITSEREARLDFTHPMLDAGLQVLAPQGADQSWFARIRSVASASLIPYLIALLLVVFVAGNVVWFAQRQHRYFPGVGRGMFKAATIGLVGDVGQPPTHPLAQVATVAWVVIGICFVSAFTASLTTHFTVQEITGGIDSVRDLAGKRVVTVKDTTSDHYLTAHRINFFAVPTIEDALVLLNAGDADAIVFDAPVLQHYVQVTDTDRFALVGDVFQREDYGIALPQGSPLRESINATLLEMRADGSYDRIYEHYFGGPR